MTQRERHTYDHRVKAQVIAARNPHRFPEREDPTLYGFELDSPWAL